MYFLMLVAPVNMIIQPSVSAISFAHNIRAADSYKYDSKLIYCPNGSDDC